MKGSMRQQHALRARIRAATRNGQDLFELLVAATRGELDGAKVPMRERLRAAGILLDRIQVARGELSAAFGLAGLSDDAQDGPAH